jgi:hypothetical protein
VRTADLDAWLPSPAVRTRHTRSARAGAADLWDAAATVRLDEARSIGQLIRWRLPGTPADVTFRELFTRYPFVVLEEGDGWSLSGMCGRIWTLNRDYPRLDGAEEFRAWHTPGTVRVLFAHWVEDDEDGRARLVSEARVEPVDRRARMLLRSLWLVVGRFERLIGAEPLALAVRRAERGERVGPVG